MGLNTPNGFIGLGRCSAVVASLPFDPKRVSLDSEEKTEQANCIQDGILATSVFTLISFQALHCAWSFTNVIPWPVQWERRF